MQTETIETHQIKTGDRVEFRQYGYRCDHASGKVIKVDAKGVVVRVDRAMRSARVEFSDILKVLG